MIGESPIGESPIAASESEGADGGGGSSSFFMLLLHGSSIAMYLSVVFG